MSASIDRLHPRHLGSSVRFTANDRCLLIHTPSKVLLLANSKVNIDPATVARAESVANSLALISLLKSSTQALSAQAALQYFQPRHPATSSEQQSAKVLFQQLQALSLIHI